MLVCEQTRSQVARIEKKKLNLIHGIEDPIFGGIKHPFRPDFILNSYSREFSGIESRATRTPAENIATMKTECLFAATAARARTPLLREVCDSNSPCFRYFFNGIRSARARAMVQPDRYSNSTGIGFGWIFFFSYRDAAKAEV